MAAPSDQTTKTLAVTGGCALAVGGLLGLVSLSKSSEAAQLEGVHQVSSLADLKALVALAPVVVAVAGRVVTADRPLRGDLAPCDAAIVDFREERRTERRVGFAGSGAWLSDAEPLVHTVRETEWALADGSGVRLPVADGRAADGDFMAVTADVWTPSGEGVVGQLVGHIAGSRTLGTRKTERALPVGTLLTAVGELAAAPAPGGAPAAFKGAPRAGGDVFVLRAPRAPGAPRFLLSRRPFHELVAAAGEAALVARRAAWVFAGVGAGLLAVAAARRLLARRRRAAARARVEKALRERDAALAARREAGGAPAAAAGDDSGDGGGGGGGGGEGQHRSLCVVCLERPPDAVFPACGHLCACSRCAPALARCPVCRARGSPIKVYVT